MSVASRLYRSVLLGGIVTLAVVVAGVAVSTQVGGNSPGGGLPAVSLRAPGTALDIVASRTPTQSAVEVSRRLYSSSPVAVLANAADLAATRRAVRAARTLRVPVLLDSRAGRAELRRLEASTVLMFGRTHTVPGGRVVPATESGTAAEVARVRTTFRPASGPASHVFVMIRSRAADVAAVSTARSAGAEILVVPAADPRRTPAAATALAERPKSPVIALGTQFTKHLPYTLAVVRRRATQAAGGYLALPGKRYTAIYGHPGTPSLGVLGEQGVTASVTRVRNLAREYQALGDGRIVPTFEIIATVASAGAGADNNYSNEVPVATLRPLIDAAGRSGTYVILDLQPGRTDFLTQARRYRTLLERPYVGLALDPEWRLKKDQKHLRQIGSVKIEEVNRVGDWLAALTRRRTLPQKLFVLHQFTPSMIEGRSRLDTDHAELATVLHVDGSGSQGAKQGTWKLLHKNAPKGVFWGWKNFVDEDEPMLTVQQTWQVRPRPDLISYQ